jgi:hypothetical protein
MNKGDSQQIVKLLSARGMEPAELFFWRATQHLLGTEARDGATLGGWTADDWAREVRQRLRVKCTRRVPNTATYVSNGRGTRRFAFGGWRVHYLYDRREMADLLLAQFRRQLLAVPR